jgi:hypothetical protein
LVAPRTCTALRDAVKGIRGYKAVRWSRAQRGVSAVNCVRSLWTGHPANAFEKNAAARQINEDCERFQRDRTEAKQRWDAAVTAETQECSGGQGSKCLSKREITKQRRSDYDW